MALSHDPIDTLDIGKQSYISNTTFDGTSFPSSFSAPAQINISGNARVHLGDQYNHGNNPVSAASQSMGVVRPNGSAMVSTAMQAIELALLVLSVDVPDTGCIYGSVHVQLASEALQSQRQRLLTFIAALEQPLPAVGRQLQKASELENSILLDLLLGTANVVDGLAATLNDVYAAASTHRFSSLRQLIASVNSDKDIIADMVQSLGGLGERGVLLLLISLRPMLTSDGHTFPTATYSTERILLLSIRTLWEQHKSLIEELYSIMDTLSAAPGSNAEACAHEWLSKHAAHIANCVQNIIKQMSAERNRSVHQHILSSLAYTEMNRRYHAIHQGHARTLDWLFTCNDNASSLTQYNFSHWLQTKNSSHSDLYWVRGKPGSGKSTLMRYVLDNARTRELGKSWAAGRPFHVVSCFFWTSGTVLQRSQEGMLQTLLYQLLTASDAFTRNICPTRWSLLELSLVHQPWSTAELRDAIERFVAEHNDLLHILILVDGLDEYQGTQDEREYVCAMLKSLSQYTNVKVCVSSRPWNVYKDAFQNAPQMRLEFLTRKPIRNFIEDQFEANNRYLQWSLEDPQSAEQLIDSLVQKASGVFLWVRLVVRIVLKGLQDGDNTKDLNDRLAEIPTDLEDLFRRLLSQIEPPYLEHASKTFELALRGSNHDNLVLVHYLIHEHRNVIVSTAPTDPLSTREILQRQRIQERRINAHCMGLLELIPLDQEDMQSFRKVEFLHRTARDFMATEEIYHGLLSWRKAPWNMATALFEARVRLIQSCDPQQPWMPVSAQLDFVPLILHHLAKDDSLSIFFPLLAVRERLFDILLNTARQYAPMVWRKGDEDSLLRRLNRDRSDFLGLAIEVGAIPYVLSRLPKISRDEIQARTGRPLLDFALLSLDKNHFAPSLDLVKGLLALGASPNAVWANTTVWARFLSRLLETSITQETITMYVEVTRLLIVAGAPGKVYVGNLTGTITLESILKAKFPKKEADELLSLRGGVRGHVQAKKNKMKFWVSSSPR